MSTPHPPLFYWLVSGIYLLSFAFYLSSLLCLLNLLYCIFYRNRALNLELSNFLKLNLICWSLMLTSGLPHIIYMSYRVVLIILSFSDGSEGSVFSMGFFRKLIRGSNFILFLLLMKIRRIIGFPNLSISKIFDIRISMCSIYPDLIWFRKQIQLPKILTFRFNFLILYFRFRTQN